MDKKFYVMMAVLAFATGSMDVNAVYTLDGIEVSADRKKGGHVFDLDLEEGRVIFNKADRFILDMPHNKQFERGDLTAASQEEIKQIEQGK